VPVLALHREVRGANPALPTQTFWRSGSAPVRFPAGLFAEGAPTAASVPALAMIGIGTLAVAATLMRGGRLQARGAWRHGALWAVVGMVMSLKPVRGQAAFELLQQWMPLLQPLRAPVRLGVAGLIGLAILAGAAFATCAAGLAERGRRWIPVMLAGCLVGAMYADYRWGVWGRALGRRPLRAAYPLQEVPAHDSPIIRLLQEPGGPLLEVPIGWGTRQEAPRQARAMYRSIFHWRPVLNGYSGYWPKEFPTRMGYARVLPNVAALDLLRRQTGLAAVLVHTDDLDASARAAWMAVAADGGPDLRLVARDGSALLFAVGPP